MDLLRSLPIGLYVEKPITWLHRLDPRVKLLWLMGFLLIPVQANSYFRLSIIVLLFLLTFLAKIPFRLTKTTNWLVLICFLTFLLTLIMPDGLGVDYQSRLPITNLQLPPATDYNYVLFDKSWITITRRSLDLAVRFSTLVFTLVYSTNLFLLTTAPEEITASLENLLQPLVKFKIPVTEIVLTLTLSLRFIPLVLEEIQNLARSVRTRAIDWQKLGFRKGSKVWLIVVERLVDNLLLRAEQIAIAMEVRGFTTPNQHRVQWHQFRLYWGDWLANGFFVLFCLTRLIWGNI